MHAFAESIPAKWKSGDFARRSRSGRQWAPSAYHLHRPRTRFMISPTCSTIDPVGSADVTGQSVSAVTIRVTPTSASAAGDRSTQRVETTSGKQYQTERIDAPPQNQLFEVESSARMGCDSESLSVRAADSYEAVRNVKVYRSHIVWVWRPGGSLIAPNARGTDTAPHETPA